MPTTKWLSEGGLAEGRVQRQQQVFLRGRGFALSLQSPGENPGLRRAVWSSEIESDVPAS